MIRETINRPYDKLLVKDLQEQLRLRNLRISGSKKDLVERLRQADEESDKQISARRKANFQRDNNYLTLFPTEIIVLICSRMTLDKINILLKSNRILKVKYLTNEEFWKQLYMETIRKTPPPNILKWYEQATNDFFEFISDAHDDMGIGFKRIIKKGLINETLYRFNRNKYTIKPEYANRLLGLIGTKTPGGDILPRYPPRSLTAHQIIAQILIDRGANDYKLLFESAITHNHLDLLRLVRDSGVELSTRASLGAPLNTSTRASLGAPLNTSLPHALDLSIKSHISTFSYLIDNWEFDSDLKRTLELAITRGRSDIVELILARNQKLVEEKNPLVLEVKTLNKILLNHVNDLTYRINNSYTIIKLLREHGANNLKEALTILKSWKPLFSTITFTKKQMQELEDIRQYLASEIKKMNGN